MLVVGQVVGKGKCWLDGDWEILGVLVVGNGGQTSSGKGTESGRGEGREEGV